ncbi:Ribonuclease P protein subunit p21, partial [Linderina pennispora]
MGKAKEPKSGVLPQRETYERMNFLYQSAQFYAQLSQNSNPETSLLPLARFYSKEMRSIARKSVSRLSPHVKRGICKVCSTPLLPGISCTKRASRGAKRPRVTTTCTYCGTHKSLPSNPDYVL